MEKQENKRVPLMNLDFPSKREKSRRGRKTLGIGTISGLKREGISMSGGGEFKTTKMGF